MESMPLVIGIGAYQCGELRREDDGTIRAFITPCEESYTGDDDHILYRGDKFRVVGIQLAGSGMSGDYEAVAKWLEKQPDVEWVITGMNDTLEAGYACAVFKYDPIEIPHKITSEDFDKYLEAAAENDNVLYTTPADTGWREHTVGAEEWHVTDKILWAEDPRTAGWRCPDLDQ